MSLNRLNRLLMSGVVPFNFGMTYEKWLAVYDMNIPGLCPTNPRDWPQEKRDLVDKQAMEENALVDRLMSLPDDQFFLEVDKLERGNDYRCE